jgi:Rrf2 family protein
MRIGNKADYALHAMIYIAAYTDKRLSTINEIAESEGIPREYLAKILKELTEHGLLKSTKGIYGGYRLAKPAGDISFLNIIEAFEGPMYIAFCNAPEAKRDGSHRKGKCAAWQFWEDMQKRVKAELAEMNLAKIDYKKYYNPNKTGHKLEYRRITAYKPL